MLSPPQTKKKKLQTSESVHSFSAVKCPIQSEPWKKLTPLPSCYKALSTAAVPQGYFQQPVLACFQYPWGMVSVQHLKHITVFTLLCFMLKPIRFATFKMSDWRGYTGYKQLKKKSPSYGHRFDWRERQPEDGDGVQWLAFLSDIRLLFICLDTMICPLFKIT